MENTQKKHVLVRIVAREELPRKSKTFRGHLSATSLQSNDVTLGFYADEIVNDQNLGNKKPLFTSVKRGDTGVPTAFRLCFCIVPLEENRSESRMKSRLGAEKNFDVLSAPGNHAYPEKIGVLRPDRTIEGKGCRQHRPIVRISALHTLPGRFLKVFQPIVFQRLDMSHKAVQHINGKVGIQTFA